MDKFLQIILGAGIFLLLLPIPGLTQNEVPFNTELQSLEVNFGTVNFSFVIITIGIDKSFPYTVHIELTGRENTEQLLDFYIMSSIDAVRFSLSQTFIPKVVHEKIRNLDILYTFADIDQVLFRYIILDYYFDLDPSNIQIDGQIRISEVTKSTPTSNQTITGFKITILPFIVLFSLLLKSKKRL